MDVLTSILRNITSEGLGLFIVLLVLVILLLFLLLPVMRS